jgi:uncharacterized membrane protein YcaP (DUF421 family)
MEARMEEFFSLARGFWTSPAEIVGVILRTLAVYVFILVAFRLSGKREVGQLAPFDFALVLLIANSVQNAMVGPNTSLLGGLVAATVLLVVNFALGRIAVRNRRVERLLRGEARILVNRGHVYEASLRAEGLSHEDLLQALRENGCATPADCRLAVLEVDGHISVIPARTQPLA